MLTMYLLLEQDISIIPFIIMASSRTEYFSVLLKEFKSKSIKNLIKNIYIPLNY